MKNTKKQKQKPVNATYEEALVKSICKMGKTLESKIPDMSRENALLIATNISIATGMNDMAQMMKQDREKYFSINDMEKPVRVDNDALMEDFREWYENSRTNINRNVTFEFYQKESASYEEDLQLFTSGWIAMRTRITGKGHVV